MRFPLFIAIAGSCVATAVSTWAADEAPAGKPHFLFIAVDDLKPITGYLAEEPGSFLQSIYPDPGKRAAIKKILTPNIDRLAAEGLSFPRAACPSALCNPSRTALMTGIRTHRSGIYDNKEHFRDSENPAVANAITLTQNLRAQGYYAAGTGKIFHTGSVQLDEASGEITKDIPDTAHSWDVWINDHPTPREARSVRHKYSAEGLFSFGSKDNPVEQMNDYQKADLIAQVLERGKVTVEDTKLKVERTIDITRGKPFFLACGIFKPHLPWFAPQEILDLFDPNDIAIDRAYFDAMVDDLRDLPTGGLGFTEKRQGADAPGKGRFQDLLDTGLKVGGEDGDLDAWREAVRHYLACMVVADRAVGRLLAALDRSPVKRNTVVVLWSDHGWNLGTKYRMGKFALWEESANCVLIIKDPRVPSTAGQKSPAPVNLIDLYRTIAAAAFVVVPEYVAGTNISKLIVAPDTPWRVPSLTTQGKGNHSLTDGRFRFIRYKDDAGNIELYDHKSDPYELNNLAGTTKYAQVTQVFESALSQLLVVGEVP